MEMEDPTERLVAGKLEKEHVDAENIAKEIKRQGRSLDDRDISYFFPGLHELSAWSNFPRIYLPHALILGLPCVFDLEPVENKDDFQRKYRIDLETATKLAKPENPKNRYLLPNLLVRDPKQWSGKRFLEELLDISWANGVRVNSYLRARASNFDDLFENRKVFLEGFVRDIWPTIDVPVQQQILDDSRIRKFEDIPCQIGSRWTYLDVLNGV